MNEQLVMHLMRLWEDDPNHTHTPGTVHTMDFRHFQSMLAFYNKRAESLVNVQCETKHDETAIVLLSTTSALSQAAHQRVLQKEHIM